MKQFLKKYGHIWTLSYAFIYLPWFIYLEKTVTRNYTLMYTPLDDAIPFNEYFVIPYFLWFLYVILALVFFFFANKDDYYRLCAFLFTGMTLSLLICTLFPNGTNLRPAIDPGKNIWSAMVAGLYKTDTCTNVFPSIHVYNSICVHIGIMKSEQLRKYRWLRIGSLILMLAICLSTVFLKQHSVIDGIGALFMVTLIYPFIYGGVREGFDQKGLAKEYI